MAQECQQHSYPTAAVRETDERRKMTGFSRQAGLYSRIACKQARHAKMIFKNNN
jgi:hypothetical protein